MSQCCNKANQVPLRQYHVLSEIIWPCTNIMLLNGCFHIGPVSGLRAVVLPKDFCIGPRFACERFPFIVNLFSEGGTCAGKQIDSHENCLPCKNGGKQPR